MIWARRVGRHAPLQLLLGAAVQHGAREDGEGIAAQRDRGQAVHEAPRMPRDGALHLRDTGRGDAREECEDVGASVEHGLVRHIHVAVVAPRPPVQRPQLPLRRAEETSQTGRGAKGGQMQRR